MILSREEALDVMCGEGECVATERWKWGACERYVFGRDGKHYMFQVYVHYSDGVQGDEVEAYEVRPVEKTVTEWELV